MIDLRFEADVRVDESPVGPVVRPPILPGTPDTHGPAGPAQTVVLYLHSDRYLSGTGEPVPGSARRLALRTGATVVCARYRPAFPAALEDVYAGYCSSQAAGPVVVVGERAGAQLAAALPIRLRNSGAPPPRCAVLVSALLDLSLQAPSLPLNAAADPAFDADRLRRRVARYAAGTSPTDPC
jgi:epsilon-lactone hydrolase